MDREAEKLEMYDCESKDESPAVGGVCASGCGLKTRVGKVDKIGVYLVAIIN